MIREYLVERLIERLDVATVTLQWTRLHIKRRFFVDILEQPLEFEAEDKVRAAHVIVRLRHCEWDKAEVEALALGATVRSGEAVGLLPIGDASDLAVALAQVTPARIMALWVERALRGLKVPDHDDA